MNLFKKILTVTIAALLLFAWVSISAISDYKWSDRVASYWGDQGYLLIKTSDNRCDLVRPWHLFKAPISVMIFCESSGVKQLDGEYLTAGILCVENESFERTVASRQVVYCHSTSNLVAVTACDSMWTPSENAAKLNFVPMTKGDWMKDVLEWMQKHHD
jgi:hypothetical protein